MTCRCQSTGHDPGCPENQSGVYRINPAGGTEKLSPVQIINVPVANLPELPKFPELVLIGMPPRGELRFTKADMDGAVAAAKAEVYREFGREGYGMADIRNCPICDKPDLHWSVSSSLSCRACRTDLRLTDAKDRIETLEARVRELGGDWK